MRNYGQSCPIARGSEILAEAGRRSSCATCSWLPHLQRDRGGAPGLSRAPRLRLRELETPGWIKSRPKPDGHGSLYEPTPAGAGPGGRGRRSGLGGGGTEVTIGHADPDVVLWSWCQEFLRRDLLPDRRVVVRFEFTRGGRRVRPGSWSRGARSRSAASIPASATTWS